MKRTPFLEVESKVGVHNSNLMAGQKNLSITEGQS